MIKPACVVVATSLVLAGAAAAAPRSPFPQLDIRKTCGSRTADMDSTIDACMRDETAAKNELGGSWAKIPAATRQTCLDEVKIGGLPSYVELLTCAQMNEWRKASAGTAPSEAATAPRRP
jgi:hypothetical protein